MNQLKYCFVIIFLLLGACYSPDKKTSLWDDNLSTEQNIAKNAIVLENNEDFSFLNDITRKHSIIILGEAGHHEYSTTEIKINMIYYLQSKGFHSIAFENFPFLLSYVFFNPNYEELIKNYNPLIGIKNLMADNEQYQSFYKTLQKQKIKTWGIDCHSTSYDIDIVKTILDKYSNYKVLSIDWGKLKELYFQKFVPAPRRDNFSTSDQYELMRMIDIISNYTQYLMSLKGADMNLKVIMQWIRNLNTNFSDVEFLFSKSEKPTVLDIRIRDIQMAENINWIIKNFPDEKLIVWCANFHGAKDISQTRYPADSLFYFNFQSMGETITATQGDKIFSLAFTSLSLPNMPDADYQGKLEMEIANTTENSPFAFINFESLRFVDGYRDQEFESSVIIKKQGKWLYIFDGLYYIRDQTINYSKEQENKK